MLTMVLVGFDVAHAATVAGWPLSAAESTQWCGLGEFPVPPDVVAAWSEPEDVRAFLLTADSRPVGYGELWRDDDKDGVEIARLIVAPEHRGRGAGRHLVTALADLARQHCTGLVFLRVHPDNDRAARLYLSAGFRPLDATTAAEWNAPQPVAYQWLVLPPRSR